MFFSSIFYNSYRDIENKSIPLAIEFKDMFKHTKCLLINGKYALRSLRYFLDITKFCILIYN